MTAASLLSDHIIPRHAGAWLGLSQNTFLESAQHLHMGKRSSCHPHICLQRAAFYLFLAAVLSWTVIVARNLGQYSVSPIEPE